MIPRLPDDPDAPFPPVSSALFEPDGLLAWGGDLQPRRLLNAYSQGYFSLVFTRPATAVVVAATAYSNFSARVSYIPAPGAQPAPTDIYCYCGF